VVEVAPGASGCSWNAPQPLNKVAASRENPRQILDDDRCKTISGVLQVMQA